MPAQSARLCDHHALLERLVDDVLEEAFLELDVELGLLARMDGRRVRVLGRGLRGRGCHGRRDAAGARADVDVDCGARRVRGDVDALDFVEDRTDGVDVLAQRRQDRRLIPEDVDALRCCPGQEWGNSSREDERCSVNTLNRQIQSCHDVMQAYETDLMFDDYF